MTDQPVLTPARTTLRQNHTVLKFVLRTFLTISFPILLVLVMVRLIMTPAFLMLEYNRPGFPADFYGLTREDRLQYAPYALEYLFNGEEITFLGDLTFPDGTPMFNARELRHMHDVKIVTQLAFGVALIVGIAYALAVIFLWRKGWRSTLRLALFSGSLLTLGIIFSIIFVAVLNWDFFFTAFHTLFFEDDTWYFAYSDTLIRLFPEQFWFDAALLIGGLTTLVSLLVLGVTWRWKSQEYHPFDTPIAQ